MLSNLVEETTNSPGNALTINLLGAPQNRRGFVTAFGNNAQAYYALTDGVNTEWGIGTVHAGSPNTLDRTTVLGNTAGTTARLSFVGACRVYNEVPAERMRFIGPRVLAPSLIFQTPGIISVPVPPLCWRMGAALIGGGGQGGGGWDSPNTGGAGGGAGGYAYGEFDVTPGSVLTGYVGQGGGVANLGAAGATGETTTLASLISATGGAGGEQGTYPKGGLGGTGVGGILNMAGGDGHDAFSAPAGSYGGHGGSSFYGGGSRSGEGARVPGAGGAGAPYGTRAAGAYGAAGLIAVWFF